MNIHFYNILCLNTVLFYNYKFQDVEILNKKLPNIVEKFTVTPKRLNHFDFIYGLHVRDIVYNHLIEKMNSVP